MLNQTVIGIFAPILVATGVLGFILPTELALMSGETPYNIFHILFGILGLNNLTCLDVRGR